MFNFALIIFVTGLCVTFLGYWVHKLFHSPLSRWFYNAHMNHHTIQYPPTDFFSDTYRSAGDDNTAKLFAIAFIPVVLIVIALGIFGILSVVSTTEILFGLGFWGWVHDYIHDQFHIRKTWLKHLPMFLTWRKLHYLHHLDMGKNFGIISYLWDKLFKTFADDDVELF